MSSLSTALIHMNLNPIRPNYVLFISFQYCNDSPTFDYIECVLQVGRNICHGSDAVESANKEIALWFKPEELCDWTSAQKDWIYE